MVSKILKSRIIRTSLQHPTKLRNLRNLCECKKSKDAPPSEYSCDRCLPEADDCEAAEHAKRQPEAFACNPDCRKGKPNIQPRGCLPWERGSEICQEASPVKNLLSPTCEHFCESFAGEEVVKNLEMSVCEFRRFRKCLAKTNDGNKCLDLKSRTRLSKKVYPMMHAESKNTIAGCPVKELSAFVIPKKDNCSD